MGASHQKICVQFSGTIIHQMEYIRIYSSSTLLDSTCSSSNQFGAWLKIMEIPETGPAISVFIWQSRWWCQTFFIFTPTWGNDPIWRSYFSNVLEPPTSNVYNLVCFSVPWFWTSLVFEAKSLQPQCEASRRWYLGWSFGYRTSWNSLGWWQPLAQD